MWLSVDDGTSRYEDIGEWVIGEVYRVMRRTVAAAAAGRRAGRQADGMWHQCIT